MNAANPALATPPAANQPLDARAQQLLQLAQRDIEQDSTDYQALQRLMRELYQQLLARNGEQINQLNQQITVLIDFTRTRAQRRSKILAVFNLGYAQGAMAKLIALYPADIRQHINHSWQQLATLVQTTRDLNERNGNLLAMHNDILTQLLSNRQGEQVYSARYY